MMKNKMIGILEMVLYPLEALVKRTNWYKNNIPDLARFPQNTKLDSSTLAHVVNIGSSSAVFDFNYSGCDIIAYNWAMFPQSMEYGKKIIKHYHKTIKTNGVVIIPFGPFSALSVQGKWAETLNDRYYFILNKDEIDSYESVERRMKYPFLNNPIIALKRIIKDVPPHNMYSYKCQCDSTKDFTDSAAKWINIWKEEFSIKDLNSPLSEDNCNRMASRLSTVLEIIDFCLSKDLVPVIVVPPVHYTLAKYFTSVFCENYLNVFFSKLKDRNIKVFNYLLSKEFSSNSLYLDAFFMNETGAKIFTKRLLVDLQII